MNRLAHPRRAYLWSLMAIACFLIVSIIVQSGSFAQLDLRIIASVQGRESDKLTLLMEGLSWIGSTAPVIILSISLAIFLFVILQHRSELVLLIAVVAGSTIINVVLKQLFHRERPDIYRIVDEVGYGFPSGHSAGAMALYGVLTYLLWRHVATKKGRGALLFIGLLLTMGIGLSRIYLGVHYPSDVLGGYLISGAWLGLCIGMFRMREFNKEEQGR
jgi:undecaprenyl-diphosphatase